MNDSTGTQAIAIPPRIDSPELRKIIDIIIRTANPEKLVLFGSRARGDSRPDSDYDIAIFKRGLGNERTLTGQVYRSLLRDGPMESVDLLAFDPEREGSGQWKPWTVRSAIESEGIVIYG